jgi:hypothetical protein
MGDEDINEAINHCISTQCNKTMFKLETMMCVTTLKNLGDISTRYSHKRLRRFIETHFKMFTKE